MSAKTINVVCVAGARPNFMKIAPLMHEFKKIGSVDAILVHTGQHYDKNMSDRFFQDLDIPAPDVNLEVGSGSQSCQTAQIMKKFEPVLEREKPDVVIVVGDVNSTIACALVAAKSGVKVAHVEAGLRSFDRTMPEEVNRVLTDAISDYLFTTEPSAKKNLLREGIDEDKIYFVGNVMIDTLLKFRARAEKSSILDTLGLSPKSYALLTLHRPSNVDDEKDLSNIVAALSDIRKRIKIVFPMHPRTRERFAAFGLFQDANTADNLLITEPLGYLDFMKLMNGSQLVMTDSGGIQEETTILQIPCVTLRNNTERPITVEAGTNTVVGTDREKITSAVLRLIRDGCPGKRAPELWDGKAAERIVRIIVGMAKPEGKDEDTSAVVSPHKLDR